MEKQPPILSARQKGPRNLWCFLRQLPPASCRLIQNCRLSLSGGHRNWSAIVLIRCHFCDQIRCKISPRNRPAAHNVGGQNRAFCRPVGQDGCAHRRPIQSAFGKYCLFGRMFLQNCFQKKENKNFEYQRINRQLSPTPATEIKTTRSTP